MNKKYFLLIGMLLFATFNIWAATGIWKVTLNNNSNHDIDAKPNPARVNYWDASWIDPVTGKHYPSASIKSGDTAVLYTSQDISPTEEVTAYMEFSLDNNIRVISLNDMYFDDSFSGSWIRNMYVFSGEELARTTFSTTSEDYMDLYNDPVNVTITYGDNNTVSASFN